MCPGADQPTAAWQPSSHPARLRARCRILCSTDASTCGPPRQARPRCGSEPSVSGLTKEMRTMEGFSWRGDVLQCTARAQIARFSAWPRVGLKALCRSAGAGAAQRTVCSEPAHGSAELSWLPMATVFHNSGYTSFATDTAPPVTPRAVPSTAVCSRESSQHQNH